jgi:hypothetical protein
MKEIIRKIKSVFFWAKIYCWAYLAHDNYVKEMSRRFDVK